MQKEDKSRFEENRDRRIKSCRQAPEWAEHARFDEIDEPCDEGRAARSCGNRKGEKPCAKN